MKIDDDTKDASKDAVYDLIENAYIKNIDRGYNHQETRAIIKTVVYGATSEYLRDTQLKADLGEDE